MRLKTLKQRGIDVVAGLADAAKKKPAHVGIAVLLLGLFLARGQIARILRRSVAAAPTRSLLQKDG